MRVLVCGGRNFSDRLLLTSTLNGLDSLTRIACIIHGDASGADALAEEWAKNSETPILRHPADWKRYGKQAGPIRNRQMLLHGNPDIVVAFTGGLGTEDMIRKARQASLPVLIVGANVGF